MEEEPTEPKAKPTMSESDRVEPIKGFKSVMVQTMTKSGQVSASI